VRTPDVATDAVTTGKIRNGQVTDGDLAAGAVNSPKVADESLTGVDIANNSLAGNDVANDSLTGNDVANNSLTGDQIAESSLSTVPSAELGGYGFFTKVSGAPEGCNPNSQTFVDCGFSRMDLPQATRVLVIATVRALGSGSGYCRLLSNKGGSVFYTETFMGSGENTTLVASIKTATAGQEDYGVECNEFNSGIEYQTVSVIPLAVSPA
jgi:hypothetical protein